MTPLLSNALDAFRNNFQRGGIKRNALTIYVLQFLTLGCGLITGVIVARSLGPEQKGVYDLFRLLLSFIQEFGLLGFGAGLLYYVANRREPLAQAHGTAFYSASALGLLTAGLGWLAMPMWQRLLPGLDARIVLLAFCLSPMAYYGVLAWHIMLGIGSAAWAHGFAALTAAVSLVALMALGSAGHLGLVNVVLIAAAGVSLSAAVSFAFLWRREPRLAFSPCLARKGIGYGLLIYVGAITNVLHFKVDQLMICYWLGTAEVGVYTIAVSWAQLLFLMDAPIVAAALPRISSSPPREGLVLAKRLGKVQLAISGLAALCLAASANFVVRALYGDAYAGAVWPQALLLPGVVVWSSCKIWATMLVYRSGLGGYVAGAATIGLAANVAMNILFLHFTDYGLIGVAIASSLSYSMVGVLIVLKGLRYGREHRAEG